MFNRRLPPLWSVEELDACNLVRDQSHSAPVRIRPTIAAGIEGLRTMKTLLAGITLAIAMLFAFEAFAMPYCTGGTYKDGYFVCTSIHDNE